jgi:cytochrome c-type biogenesis protein CcmI
VIPAVIVAVLALVALVWVLAPIRRGVRRDVDGASHHVEEAVAQKDAALDAMVDIENERELGKLSDADFEALRAEYEREALAALRALETAEIEDVDDQLEAEVAAMKAQLGGVSNAPTCPECGTERTPGRPCPSCGSTS